jgi:hypothetical protein
LIGETGSITEHVIKSDVLINKTKEEIRNICEIEFGPRILQRDGPYWKVADELNQSEQSPRKLIEDVLHAWVVAHFRGRISSNTVYASQYIIPHIIYDAMSNNTRSMFYGRRIATLTNGKLVLLPGSARKGDVICCFAGSLIPYILRPIETSDQISDAFIRKTFPAEDPQSSPPEASTNITSPLEIYKQGRSFDCRRCLYFEVCTDYLLSLNCCQALRNTCRTSVTVYDPPVHRACGGSVPAIMVCLDASNNVLC